MPLAPELATRFAEIGQDCFIEAPFHCAYGTNLSLGDRVYFNAGCVWIGGGAIILSDMSIGDGAIIGAGSVVTTSVAPGETVVGNPARLIKARD